MQKIKLCSKTAFTLAEVLITLGVIGVIAAMTLPTVIKNYQKKVTVEKLKSTYSMLYQAIRRSEVDNGTLDTWEIPSSTSYNVVKPFAEKYFNPYLKNIKECKHKECISTYYYGIDGTRLNSNISFYTLILTNGTVLWFYPRGDINLAEIKLDLNGLHGPNTNGKDRFHLIAVKQPITSAFLGEIDKPGLYFYGQGKSNDYLKSEKYACSKTLGTELRGQFCGALIMQNNWHMPDDYPW